MSFAFTSRHTILSGTDARQIKEQTKGQLVGTINVPPSGRQMKLDEPQVVVAADGWIVLVALRTSTAARVGAKE